MSDEEQSTPCAMRYAMFVKILAFSCGVMQCIIGVIQLFEAFNYGGVTSFCDSLPSGEVDLTVDVTADLGQNLNNLMDTLKDGIQSIGFNPKFNKKQLACIGPQIRWVRGDSTEFDFTSNVNGQPSLLAYERSSWRGVFSLQPKVFIDLWTPLVFGVISVFLHMGQTRSDKIADNWVRFSLWFVLQALWGSFGYAGNMGIITGFLGVAVSFFALLALCIAPNEPRALNLHGLLGMIHVGGGTEK